MAKIIIDFLQDSFLYEEKHYKNNYSNFSQLEIENELEQYRNYILKNKHNLFEKATIYKNQIKIYQPELEFSFQKIKQMAFYLDQVIIKDKLFELSTPEKKFTDVYKKLLGDNTSDTDKYNKTTLANIIKEIKSVEEMILYDYLFLFPISYFNETGTDIPIRFSEDGYANILPENILQFYYDNVELRSFKNLGKMKYRVNNTFEIARTIDISFKDEENMKKEFYNLFEQKITSYNSKTGEVSFEIHLPEEPPTKEMFNSWVNQSINTTAISHFENTILNINLSHELKSYLSPSIFSHKLLSQNFQIDNNIETNVINSILNFDLNFYDDIDIKTLMSLKNNDGEEFQIFRKSLEHKLKEIRSISDNETKKRKIEDIQHELEEVEIANINKKILNAKSTVVKDLGIGLGGLALSSLTSGTSLIATFYSLAAGYKNYDDYIRDVKLSPAYFLWKIKNKLK